MLSHLDDGNFTHCFVENRVENYEVGVFFLKVLESVAEAVHLAVCGAFFALPCALR